MPEHRDFDNERVHCEKLTGSVLKNCNVVVKPPFGGEVVIDSCSFNGCNMIYECVERRFDYEWWMGQRLEN